MGKRNACQAVFLLVVTLVLGGCQTPTTCPVVTAEPAKTLTPDAASKKDPVPMVKVLQRRIHDRDRRIAELTNQLETLRHIELDVRTDKKFSPSVR